MISITFQGSWEEVQKELRQVGMTPHVMVEPSKPTANKPVEKSVKAAEKPVEVSEDALEKPKAEPSVDVLAEIKSIIPKLVKKLGRPAVVELLAEFGATSGGEIKETDRNLFLSKAHTLLSE